MRRRLRNRPLPFEVPLSTAALADRLDVGEQDVLRWAVRCGLHRYGDAGPGNWIVWQPEQQWVMWLAVVLHRRGGMNGYVAAGVAVELARLPGRHGFVIVEHTTGRLYRVLVLDNDVIGWARGCVTIVNLDRLADELWPTSVDVEPAAVYL